MTVTLDTIDLFLKVFAETSEHVRFRDFAGLDLSVNIGWMNMNSRSRFTGQQGLNLEQVVAFISSACQDNLRGVDCPESEVWRAWEQFNRGPMPYINLETAARHRLYLDSLGCLSS